LEFPFEIGQRHVQVAHGHVWIDMTEQAHQRRQAHAGPQHLRRVGVPELVRDDACRKTDLMTDLVEIIAELANERLFAARSRQEEAIVGSGSSERRKRSL
jgi:hypothetical protein